MKTKYYFQRFAAALIDIVIISLTILILIKISYNPTNLEDENIPSYLFIPFFYLYFIISELIFRTTLGKRIFKLRVNTTGGFRLLKIIVRNLFNLFELIIPLIYIIPIIITGISKSNKPRKIGDLLARTTIE